MLARSIRLVIYYLKHKTVPITSWNMFVPCGRAIDSILPRVQRRSDGSNSRNREGMTIA